MAHVTQTQGVRVLLYIINVNITLDTDEDWKNESHQYISMVISD